MPVIQNLQHKLGGEVRQQACHPKWVTFENQFHPTNVLDADCISFEMDEYLTFGPTTRIQIMCFFRNTCNFGCLIKNLMYFLFPFQDCFDICTTVFFPDESEEGSAIIGKEVLLQKVWYMECHIVLQCWFSDIQKFDFPISEICLLTENHNLIFS